MSNDRRIARALAALLPRGALSASVLLALTSSVSEARAAASEPAPPTNVAERLSAIRAAMPDVGRSNPAQSPAGSGEFAPGTSPRAEPTWWGNGGWGRWRLGWGNGGWHNWPNWHNWGNGGWGNGGWGNGGWHNYWHNW